MAFFKTKKEKEKSGGTASCLEYLHDVVYILALILIVFTFCMRVVIVSGSSMFSTLVDGDYLLLINRPLCGEFEQGDIVVLRQDTFRNEPIVKRVIATEGQTVDIDFEECLVYVDGVALDEPYTKDYGNYSYYDQQDFDGEITVPEGCVFVMGDNRNGSTDSRTESIGCVDARKILGKVIFRIGPLDKIGFVE